MARRFLAQAHPWVPNRDALCSGASRQVIAEDGARKNDHTVWTVFVEHSPVALKDCDLFITHPIARTNLNT